MQRRATVLACLSGVVCIATLVALLLPMLDFRASKCVGVYEGATRLTRYATFPGPYGIQAVQNLSHFRSTLFQNTFRTLQDTEHKSIPGIGRYNIYNAVVNCPPGTHLKRIGENGTAVPETVPSDGAKYLCLPTAATAGCKVYSFGSRNDYSFESSMLKLTPCVVHTYDCTVDGWSIDPERHFFHKICIGSSEAADIFSNVVTYHQALQQNGDSEVWFLKADIDAFEFSVFGEWKASDVGLPLFLSMEMHFWLGSSSFRQYHFLTSKPGKEGLAAQFDHSWHKQEYSQQDLSLFFFHLADLGYAVLSREDNLIFGAHCCSEFVFLRVETIQH